jgi:DNA-binding CsgD family transcriptional regulator
VLRLMARGANTEEIGQLLALSRNTVISHAKSIYRKLDVHSRAEALAQAASRRLLG